MREYTNATNTTRLSASSLPASRVVSARRSIPDDSWAPNQLVPGTTYRIIRPLGAGGMGQVFEVEDERILRRFALKAIHRSLCVREDLAQRFRDEALVLGQLHDHPNLVDVVGAGEAADGRTYLVMELLKGCSLEHELFAQRELPSPLETRVPWACAVLGEVLAALGAAHGKGIFHRDVKPANVFLLAKGGVKLLDFGIAGFFAPRPGSRAKTQPGQLPGTPAYMPPERLQGGGADARTDVFSAGVMLWETLACRRAVTARDPTVAAVQIVQEGIPSLGSEPELRQLPALVAAVDRATAYDAGQRFATVEAFAEALRAAVAGFEVPANVGPLVGLATAPVPFLSEAEAETTTDAGASPTREVNFASPTAPEARTEEQGGAGKPSSVDPYGGTPLVGFELAAEALRWAARRDAAGGAEPRGAVREADRAPRPGSREHDEAYRDSPTMTARAEALAKAEARAVSASDASAERRSVASPPRRANRATLGALLVLALGAFGLGLTSPWRERRLAVAVQASSAVTRGMPEAAPAGSEVAVPHEGALQAVAPSAVQAPPTPTSAAQASPATPLAAQAPPAASAEETRASPVAAAVAAAPPARASTAGASAPASERSEEASASALMRKAAGMSAAAGVTGNGTATAAVAAAPRGAAAPAPGTAKGVRKVRDEGASSTPPAPSGWRLKRVIKVQL